MQLVFRLTILAALGGSILGTVAKAQEPDREFRKLAPGVMRTIPPALRVDETVSTHDVIELRALDTLKWTPTLSSETQTLFDMARAVNFRRTVHGLEFSFKPLRMIEVDIPQPSGKFQRKLVWYLVYKVKNPGGHLAPERQDDGTYATKTVDEPFRFFPHFVLESHEFKKAYLDRVIPAAMGPIQLREDPNRTLLNSVQISDHSIPLSTDREDRSVWGVATWLDVDPRIDFFSVYIQGLTDAYKWFDPEGAYQPGDPPGKGRRFARKTLKLNFWRPGDEFLEHEEELRYGTPPDKAALYGNEAGVDYEWVYR